MNGHPENTAKAYCSDLRMFLFDMKKTEIPKRDFEEQARMWLNRYKMVKSPKTIVRRITSLKKFAKWASWGDILEGYVAPTPGRPMPHPIPEGIEGVVMMCEAARRPEHAALVALGGFVGCRVAESLSVAPRDFDLREMILTVRGKGDRTRYVPVSANAWGYLAPVVVSRFQFPQEPLLGYGDRFARQLITDLGKRAGLKRTVSSHDLRATFATAVYDSTKDIRAVQELLGHSSVVTSQVYTQITLHTLRGAVEL
jgi:site-specific recombinase XerD